MLIGIIVAAAAIALYFFVAQPYVPGDGVPGTVHSEEVLHWRSWSTPTFSEARDRDRLVYLLITDTLVVAANEFRYQIEHHASLPMLIANRLIPVLVDRRVRPDIAERYAEGRSFQAMLLLPSGEALMVFEDDLDKWEEKITEADRYRRDHRDDIEGRIESFWSDYEDAQTRFREPRAPVASDLDSVDSAVRAFAETAIDSNTQGIWRVDVSRYLAARSATEAWAARLSQKMHTARLQAWSDDSTAIEGFPPEGLARLAIDERAWNQAREATPTADAEAFRLAIERRHPGMLYTAADVAAMAQLQTTQRDEPVPDYPGRWLHSSIPDESSLPHTTHPPEALDGYLLDAIAWLELYLADPGPDSPLRATSLADSIWSRLWSSKAHALRDKPLRDTPVREVERYPRPQLGRAAICLITLAERTNDDRWLARADSCLAGFAPYLHDSGAAAAYYGRALLMRFIWGARTD